MLGYAKILRKQAVLVVAFKVKAVCKNSKSQWNVLILTFTCNFTSNATKQCFSTLGAQKMKFPLRISSVNVTKSTVSTIFCDEKMSLMDEEQTVFEQLTLSDCKM